MLPHSDPLSMTSKGSFTMQKMLSIRPDGFWLVTFAAIIWGTIGVATQAIYNVDSTSSLFINLSRLLIATPILFTMSWRVLGRKLFSVQRRDLSIMVLSGVFLVISQAAYFAAIRYGGVTIATLLTMCISPLVVSFVSVVLKLETLTPRIMIGLVFALAGSALLVGVNHTESTSQNLVEGAFYALIAAVCYAGTLLCGRFLAADYHPLQVTTIGFIAGSVVLVVINLMSGIVLVQTAQGWLLVLYLGLIPTALAYWLFQIGLRSVSATAASIIVMLDPVVAAALAWALFGETLTYTGSIGAALLILSLFLMSLSRQPTPMVKDGC